MTFTARALEKLITEKGWYIVDQKGSLRHYKHPEMPGKITIPFHKPDELKVGTAQSIMKQAGIVEGSKKGKSGSK